jgi:FG-GAP-like repeat
MIPLLCLTAAALPFVPSTARPPAQDARPALLRARAERAPDVGPSPAVPEGAGSGSLLFTMDGGDNAECVRAVHDVNGDGRDDIVVGIGQSGTDNVFCVDGASTGVASVLWSLQTTDGVSGGDVYGDQSIVPVSDTEGNGHQNVLLGTSWGGRTAYDLDTLAGGVVWKFDTYLSAASGWVYSLCEISDVNSDGVPDYAFGAGSDSDSLYLVDGASAGPQATVLWRYPAGDAVYSVRNIGDVNGDGTDDVLGAVGDNIDRIVCLEGDTTNPAGHVLWTYTPGVGIYACGVLSDVTGDGVKEALAVLWTLGGSSIRCLNGATGAVVWSSTAVADYGMQVDELEDVTGDGKPEVIVSSWENASIVLDGADGSLVWKTTVGTTNGGDVWTSCAIDDVSGDGVQDVIAGSFDYNVYAFDGVTGETLWAFNTGNRVFSVDAVGDLTGDSRPEVVAGTQDTHSSTVVFVLEGDGGLLPDTFCDAGDGSLASCPCVNPGSPDTGCDAPIPVGQGGGLTGGLRLDVVRQDTAPTNRATVTGTGYPTGSTPGAVVIRADVLDTGSPVVFGDGLRCIGVPLVRLGATAAVGGTSTHTFGHGTMAGAGSRYYQIWYRSQPASYCDPLSSFNLSNGRVLIW